jgi:predicted N-formylglutamate amidohydrolase
MRWSVVLSCEHADCVVPKPYASCFPDRSVLETHRGYDIGALEVAEQLSAAIGVPLIANPVTRLLIDVNRSLHHRRVFSEFSRALPRSARERLVHEVYEPHRRRVENAVVAALEAGPVLHIGIHSFTPVLDGHVRHAAVGILYDPKRCRERGVVDAWKAAMHDVEPAWRVRRNYPYLGSADGLTTTLRRRWGDAEYCGLELEVNQALVAGPQASRAAPRKLAHSLTRLLQEP